jgi:hypothetical protein
VVSIVVCYTAWPQLEAWRPPGLLTRWYRDSCEAVVESSQLDFRSRLEFSLLFDGGFFVAGLEGGSHSQRPATALAWFGCHLILNAAWSLLFFGMKRFDLAMIEIVLLWISIIVISMVLYYRFSKTRRQCTAGALLLCGSLLRRV